jgi:hypothetical protein
MNWEMKQKSTETLNCSPLIKNINYAEARKYEQTETGKHGASL